MLMVFQQSLQSINTFLVEIWLNAKNKQGTGQINGFCSFLMTAR